MSLITIETLKETTRNIDKNTSATAASLERSRKFLDQIFELQRQTGLTQSMSNAIDSIQTAPNNEIQSPKQT